MVADAGVGLRHQHLAQVLDEQPDIGWFEVHSENFFYDNLATAQLEKIADIYPISMHGIGLSLGSADAINIKHLQQLKNAIERFQPSLISEHLSWSSINNHYLNDLLPLPYTQESLDNFIDKIKQTQDFLGRQILIENPSTYLRFKESTIPEWEFFAALPKLSGCGLLLDINNVFVSCNNHGYQPQTYLDSIDFDDVCEIHLAGHIIKHYQQGNVYIDDHGSKVSDEVWSLYEETINQSGKKPTLIEWDNNIPELSVLLSEAQKAQRLLNA